MSNNKINKSGWWKQPSKKMKRNEEIWWGKQSSKKEKRNEEGQKASKSRQEKIAWPNPIPIKEIKHEGFGGNLNPKWQWPKGTVVQPLYKGWNMDKTYGIKKKKKKIYWTQEEPWKKHQDLLDLDSDNESYKDPKYDHNKYLEWRQQSKNPWWRDNRDIIEAVNRMSAQREREIDELSNVEKLRHHQDLFLKWEEVENDGLIELVEIRLNKEKMKTYVESTKLEEGIIPLLKNNNKKKQPLTNTQNPPFTNTHPYIDIYNSTNIHST